MGFSKEDKDLLLTIKGVGATVITRLEEFGFTNLEDLSEAHPEDILNWVSQKLGSTCWRNSPQARSSIESAISYAQKYVNK